MIARILKKGDRYFYTYSYWRQKELLNNGWELIAYIKGKIETIILKDTNI